MAKQEQWTVKPRDVDILRGLARRQVEIAASPENAERRRLWIKHNDLRGERPMVLVEPWPGTVPAMDHLAVRDRPR